MLEKARKLGQCTDLITPRLFLPAERKAWDEYLRHKDRTAEELDQAHERLKKIIQELENSS